MKIIVFSDSHGCTTPLEIAIENEQPDAIIHLGDGWEDLPSYSSLPVHQVRGNCDSSFCDLPDARILSLCGVTCFLTHGHRYNVKYGLERLSFAARESNADLALFGHTHIPFLEDTASPVLFNPGSIGSSAGSYGIITLQNRSFSCSLHQLSR